MATILWAPVDGPGLEMLFLQESANGILADSVVLGARDGRPFRLRYRLECDARWRTRRLDVALLGEPAREISIRSVGTGKWTDGSGTPLSALDGCIDVDLAASPFTNTLPIRRVRFELGESQNFLMAYVGLPDLALSAVKQRYTRLKQEKAGAIYRYEGLFRYFTADLAVDSEGLVLDYPPVWKRIGPERR